MRGPDHFVLRVAVEIQKVDEHGRYGGDRLTTTEEFTIQASSFTAIAAVLGQFHDLAETIRGTEPGAS